MSDVVLAALATLLESGDASALAPLLTPDATIWHNFDGIDVPAADALALASMLPSMVDDLRLDVTSVLELEGGFTAQVELTGTVRASGNALLVRNCFFVWLDGDRVRWIQEYVDPTFGAQLTAVDPEVRP